MTPENFAYWLHGFFEIGGVRALTQTEAQIINDHLNLVFNKVTPNRQDISTTKIPSPFDDNENVFYDGSLGGNLNKVEICHTCSYTPPVSYCTETFRNQSGEFVPRGPTGHPPFLSGLSPQGIPVNVMTSGGYVTGNSFSQFFTPFTLGQIYTIGAPITC